MNLKRAVISLYHQEARQPPSAWPNQMSVRALYHCYGLTKTIS